MRAAPPRQEIRLVPPFPNPEILLCVRVDLEDWNYPALAAPYWRLYACDHPGARLLLPDGRSLPLSPKRLVLLPPGTVFGSASVGRVRQFALHFRLARPHRPGPLSLPLTAPRRAALRALFAPGADPEPARHRALALLHEVLASLPPSGWGRPVRDSGVAAALARMEAAFPAALPNAVLARAAGLGVNAFTRRFAAETGRTPRRYLVDLRLDHAAARLHHGPDSIDAIAESLGFGDRYHFSRLFRAREGVGPAAFRRRWRPA